MLLPTPLYWSILGCSYVRIFQPIATQGRLMDIIKLVACEYLKFLNLSLILSFSWVEYIDFFPLVLLMKISSSSLTIACRSPLLWCSIHSVQSACSFADIATLSYYLCAFLAKDLLCNLWTLTLTYTAEVIITWENFSGWWDSYFLLSTAPYIASTSFFIIFFFFPWCSEWLKNVPFWKLRPCISVCESYNKLMFLVCLCGREGRQIK